MTATPLRWSLALFVAALALSCARPQPELPSPDTLAQQVTIRRDTYGVPHILAASEEAAAFAFGYAQAEDHAVEIGRRYVRARGEEARYFGTTGIANDAAMAMFDNVNVSRQALQRIDPQYRRIISAYAAGVNRYTRSHRADLPAWMPEITAADVLANTRASAADSLAGAALVRRLREKYEGTPRTPGADAWLDDAPGSNAFALGGSRTATGKPILLGNPHLQWSSLYWEAHVRVPGRIDFYGSTLVGIPVLRAGFNDRLGFVTTNNAPDLDDVFAFEVDPHDGSRYLFDGRSWPLQTREVMLRVREPDGSIRDEPRTFLDTHLGPVIYRTGNRVFSVKSTRLEAFQYFYGFYLLSRARTLKEWMAALEFNHVPTSNFTYADADGNILYFWNGRVPVRPEGRDYRLDVVARSAGDIWTRVHPLSDLPRLLNPPGGYVQNANNPPQFASLRDPLDMAKYPSHFERGPLALRPQLALDLIEQKPRWSVADVIELKYSTRMLLAERVKREVVDAVRGTPDAPEDARAGADALEAWDDRVAASSRGAVLFQRFWDAYAGAVRQPFAVPWDPANPAATPSGIADRAAAVTHLASAVREVRERHGSERVAWGDVNRFRAWDLDLPGTGATGTYGTFHVMTFADSAAADAGASRVRVAGHLPGRTSPVGFGDAWILLVDFSRPGTAWSVLAYGQTTKPESPHSSDQLPIFAAHRLRPAWYAEADIKANLVRAYRP
ncbi:MAG TPA: penicillin acylase family protein [Vicinamibacterales bacterium]|nr:penicillin acylase family protein [Vicinamibacterales bacterium]